MNAVLYTYDLEPITIIDLPSWAYECFERGSWIEMLMPNKPQRANFVETRDDPITLMATKRNTVCIRAEDVVFRGVRHKILCTSDEESSLLLKAAFLSGQNSELQKQQQLSFPAGFAFALRQDSK